jgi:hypothetical protein
MGIPPSFGRIRLVMGPMGVRFALLDPSSVVMDWPVLKSAQSALFL